MLVRRVPSDACALPGELDFSSSSTFLHFGLFCQEEEKPCLLLFPHCVRSVTLSSVRTPNAFTLAVRLATVRGIPPYIALLKV